MAALNDLVDDLLTKTFNNTLVSAAELAISATYKSVVTGAYTPSTGAIGRTETDHSVKIIKRNESTGSTRGDSVNENADNLDFLVRPVTGVLPSQGIDDELTVDSKVYKVLNVNSVNMGSSRLLYQITAIG